MKKAVRYIGYTFRDCYRAFPHFFLMTFWLDLTGIGAQVLAPVVLAHILELAGGESVMQKKELMGMICLYGVCLVCIPVTEAVFRAQSQKARILGEKYFGSRLVAFSGKIRLEALENPETLDRFHRANAGENSQFTLFEQMVFALRSAVTGIGLMFVVGRYSILLVVTGLLSLAPSVFTKLYFEKRLTRMRRMQSSILRRCSYLRGLFSKRDYVREMRVFGTETYLTDLWKQANAERAGEYYRTNLDIRKKQVYGIFVINLCYVCNVGLSFMLMVQGKLSVGAFAACLSAFTAYDAGMSNFLVMLFQAISTYHVVEDYYDYFSVPVETDGEKVYHPFYEKIEAKDVYFRYSGSDRDALAGLTCEIKKGEHVVIVGENGSGKTTFAKLLCGAYLPVQGGIFYDGQKTEELVRKSLYAHISAVPQDFVRYRFSLRENVGISAPERMSDTEGMEALLSCVAGEDFVRELGGLDVQLGREFGGQELSGGEWQKVAIARGLWKECGIIILDEPTSALDPLAEYGILTKFVEMTQERTTVIISHRVGICRTADRIIVMKDGHMAECGKHEELLAAGGEYARIWREQAKWYQ